MTKAETTRLRNLVAKATPEEVYGCIHGDVVYLLEQRAGYQARIDENYNDATVAHYQKLYDAVDEVVVEARNEIIKAFQKHDVTFRKVYFEIS